MKKLIYYMCIICAINSSVAADTAFIVEKKKGNISCSKLKDQAVDQLGETLRLLPTLLRTIADIQEQTQNALQCYITGQKGCFWDTAGKDQLQICCAKTEQGNLQLEALSIQLADLAVYTKKLG